MLRDFLEKYPAGGRRKSAGQAERLCKARWDAIMKCTKMCPLHTVTVSYYAFVFRGVSAHCVKRPKELQDEMIARLA